MTDKKDKERNQGKLSLVGQLASLKSMSGFKKAFSPPSSVGVRFNFSLNRPPFIAWRRMSRISGNED